MIYLYSDLEATVDNNEEEEDASSTVNLLEIDTRVEEDLMKMWKDMSPEERFLRQIIQLLRMKNHLANLVVDENKAMMAEKERETHDYGRGVSLMVESQTRKLKRILARKEKPPSHPKRIAGGKIGKELKKQLSLELTRMALLKILFDNRDPFSFSVPPSNSLLHLAAPDTSWAGDLMAHDVKPSSRNHIKLVVGIGEMDPAPSSSQRYHPYETSASRKPCVSNSVAALASGALLPLDLE
jgi:hypothetical protein